jgi:ABC-type multidrug transport system, ATPase component
MPAIEVSGLHKAYGSLDAVRGVDFSIEEGEVFGLLGPNGAGKTTTVEILEGYRKRDAGKVRVLGHDPERPGRTSASGSASSSSNRSCGRTSPCARRTRSSRATTARRATSTR